MADKDKLVKISDIILFVVILAIGIIGLIYIISNKEKGAQLRISVDGEVVEEFYLSEDIEHKITTEQGINLVVVKNGVVDVVDADCPDKICVHHVPIDSVGETIICLPHKLVVEIVE